MKTIIFISLFCIGLRIVSSKGMILYFLRKPYDFVCKEINEIKRIYNLIDNKDSKPLLAEHVKMEIRYYSILQYILKPIIGCVTCMASFWTIVWGFYYQFTIVEFFMVALPVAALNAVGFAVYELIESKTNLNNEIRNINNKLKQ